MQKPFLTIDEQVEKLEKRGLIVNKDTRVILMRESYYSIINGYKEPFLDRVESGKANDDRYITGSSFDDLYTVFLFDRKLRNLTFEYIIQAEATFKTAVAYIFSKHHRKDYAFLDNENFCTAGEFYNPEKHFNELSKLIRLLNKKIEYSDKPYVNYYRENHDCVPLWVLVNDMTFGNLIHFFELMKPSEREAVSRMITEAVGRLGSVATGYFGQEQVRKAAEVLRQFRNTCAHDERLYSKVVGITPINYFQMVWLLEHFLTVREFLSFIDRLLQLVDTYIDSNVHVIELIQKAGYGEFRNEYKRRRALGFS